VDDASRGRAAGKGDGPADTAAGEGAPCLDLDGFSGPLDLLLALARAQRIDLKRIALPALLDQLAPALRQAVPLAERGGWLVAAAWLVLLRSRLLLPGPAPAGGGTGQGRAAQGRAGRGGALRQARHLQRRLLGLEQVQALAAWLDRRPQLGHDVFGRGTPGDAASAHGAAPAVDAIAFLWACMELLDGEGSRPGTAEVYAPQRPALHSVRDARTRILRLLGEGLQPQPLSQLLPDAREGPLPSAAASAAHAALLWRSGWASAFAASLELAKQGAVTLAQERGFSTILVHAGPAQHADPEKHTANQG
jgi:segregation and condensation protein A